MVSTEDFGSSNIGSTPITATTFEHDNKTFIIKCVVSISDSNQFTIVYAYFIIVQIL